MPGFYSQAEGADSPNSSAQGNALRFLKGGGQVGQMLLAGVGLPLSMQSPADWPDSIKTLVALMFSANQPMYVAWGEARHFVYNDAYIPILQDKHPSALGRPLFDVWHETTAELLSLVDKAFEGEPAQSEKIELRVERGGKLEPAWFSFFYAPVREAAGGVIGMFCACNEITAQHLAQQAIATSSQHYKSVIDAMSEGFILMDEQYRVLEMNAEALRLNNCELSDMVGRSHWELWPGSRGTPVESAYREAMQERRPVSLHHHYACGGFDHWLDLRIYPVPDGGVAAFFRDTSPSMRADALLRASEARFRAAVSAIGVVWTNNKAGEMVGDQPGWSELTGQSADEYSGYGWTKTVHPDDVAPTLKAWQRAVKSRSVFQHEHRVRVQSGEWRLFSIKAVPVFDADQQITEWVGVHIDITEARRSGAALREADQRKDEFLATLAHELRNPLAPIRNAARILLQPDVSAASVQSCADILARQATHMALLLDDLLDVSRITSGRLELKNETVTVRAIVEAAVEAARPGIAARGHRLTVSLPDEEIEISADALRLSQVLTNLLNNAAKYTEQRGQINLGVTAPKAQLHITVSDNGIGLAPESLARVFVMFSQVSSAIDRTEGGLGIGLSLARGLVELHGGELEAHSLGLGQGTTMTVRLPESLRVNRPGRQDMRPGAALDNRADESGLAILVVDDNRDAADTLAILLGMDGHRTQTAYSGVEALALASADVFDAAILDIGMPGMNGYELAGCLRAAADSQRLLLVALTGWGQESDRQKALAAGFDRHISKPVNPELLLDGLVGWVAKKRAGNQAQDARFSASAFSGLQ